MAKTFKDLQTDCLEWMSDEGDTGLMQTLVKQSLDNHQRRILTQEQYDFMLSPLSTISVTAPTTKYRLPDDFLQALYWRDPDRSDFYEEVPPKGLLEAEDGLSQSEGVVGRLQIAALQGIITQPSAAGTVTVATTGGTELAANSIVVQGLDANGGWVEEQLSSGSPWTNLTSTASFASISNIIKVGASWTRTITVARGVTILTLLAGEFVKEYTILELLNTPTESQTIQFKYYKKPIPLVYDNQLPQIPEQFSDILLYETLIGLQGFTKATAVEIQNWQNYVNQLETQMKQTYQQARSLGARARYVQMIERI